ncbi:hypothetical protein ACFQE0_14690 [Methylobacterium komagatae]|uniref:Uncharacterized protein n=1 Tax=Methylobacterium komagatae TaxID=374425 RepID=A0ABW2BJY9_9HYPH
MADAPAPASYVVTFDEQLPHPTDPGHWMRTGRTIRVTYAPGGQVVQAIDAQAVPGGPWEPLSPPPAEPTGAAS